ncbi:hypothetical protein GGI07_001953 [Coemansia sp. Benny D115]|nr:hypothetical protein GGI07_001953 [Coemansia sp. Benny D115]
MAKDENGRWIVGSLPYKLRAGIVLSVYIVYVIYVIVTFTMFIMKARDKHSGLHQRNIKLVTLQVAGCFFMGAVGMISTSIQQWPCFLKLWFVDIGFLVMYSAVAARAFQHIVVTNVHILTNKLASSNNPAFRGTMPQSSINYLNPSTRPNRSASQSSIFSNTDFEVSDGTHIDSEKKAALGLEKHIRHASTRMENGPDMKVYKRLQKYTRLQRYATDKALFIFVILHLLLAVILSLIVNILNKQFSLSPMSKTCKMIWGFLPVISVIVLYAVVILPFLFVKCWSLHDAYGIRNDILVSSISGTVCVIMTIIWETVLFHIALRWSGWFFSWLCAAIIQTVSVAMPLWSAIRHSRDVIDRMHGASSLGTSMAAVISGAGGHDLGKRSEFNSMLADPYEYRYFCDFAASCFCSEMSAFIDEYQALKSLTVVALGSDDIWREDADQLEPGYMSRMAATTIDGDIGYLAMAGRGGHANSKTLRLQTPPTVSILETAKAVYPQYDLNELTPFPVAAMDKLVAIFSVFVNSNSYTAVSLPSAMVLRIREKLGKSQLTLIILDEIKDEVLNMLYFDVFTRYVKRK